MISVQRKWSTVLIICLLLITGFIFRENIESRIYFRLTSLWLFFADKSSTGLFLDGTNISDSGLRHLKKFKNLENLIISDTKITDR